MSPSLDRRDCGLLGREGGSDPKNPDVDVLNIDSRSFSS